MPNTIYMLEIVSQILPPMLYFNNLYSSPWCQIESKTFLKSTKQVYNFPFCVWVTCMSLRRRSNSIPWCISFRCLLSLRMWRHYLFHALGMKAFRAFPGVLSRLSEWITVWIAWLCFQGYRFYLYSLRFQWEFWRYSEGFYCPVSLVCREVHISYVEIICKRRSLIPAVVANLPADELFAGVRSPELIRILKFFLWYHGIKHLKILRLFQAC